MLLIKIILIVSFLSIFFQDFKTRQVYWFLFPLVGFCCGYLHYVTTLKELFLLTILTNFILVSILLFIIVLYVKLKLKAAFKTTFGVGDILFFLAIVFSFPTISFSILFVFSLIFSLLLHFFFKKSELETVPLAGYMSLFYATVYIMHWFGLVNNSYKF